MFNRCVLLINRPSTRLFATKQGISTSVSKLLSQYDIPTTASDFEHDLKQPLLTHLKHRGLVETCVNEEQLIKDLETRKLGLYCGADPTAKSLHLGNLLPLMILLHFNIRGHNVTGLVGSATGAVGDPSGRTTERDAMSNDTRLTNVSKIALQMSQFFENGLGYAKSRNPFIEIGKTGERRFASNEEWWKDIGMLEFLSKFGKYIRINQMLARDSVKNRLTSEQGLGYNEFSYQILQAYDFYHLNKNCGVDVQVGGNDQYGNIVAGIDFITRLKKQENFNPGLETYGLTVPLLTTSTGVKFGKSAGNAIFIDKELTPSYGIYQFMYNTSDEDVKKFMYNFSMLPIPVIDNILLKHGSNKKLRIGQKFLAIEMCDLTHGDGEGYHSFVLSESLYGNSGFSPDEILNAFKKQNMLASSLTKDEFNRMNIGELLYGALKGTKSKSECKRMIKSGAVSASYLKFTSMDELISEERLLGDKLLLLKVGKQYYAYEILQ